MATIVGGIGTTHVPSIGNAIAKGLQRDPYWKPFFDGFAGAQKWLGQVRPDAVVVFYNDHGLNFFLDKMPTFAIGAARRVQARGRGMGAARVASLSRRPRLLLASDRNRHR